jgi:hypothetical protein
MSQGTVIPKNDPRQLVAPVLDQREWLTPKELAGRFGLNEESAYRWRRELIPDVHPKTKRKLVRYAGTRLLFFHVDTIGYLEQKFAEAHD